MIFDRIDKLHKYKGIYKYLDAAIEYIEKTDLNKLEIGKNVIDGENLYVNIVESNLIFEEEGVYEFHKQYLDLHIDIEGKEKVLFADLKTAELIEEYKHEGDYGLGNNELLSSCLLNDSFCVCMTEELHMPLVKVDNCQKVKKAIFKIKI